MHTTLVLLNHPDRRRQQRQRHDRD
jgi:hypothetical protein